METLIIGEGEGYLDLREIAKTIEKSTSIEQLLRKWRLFGEELNLKDDVILDLQQRMNNGTYELSDLPRRILKIWKANQGSKATLKKLCDALEDCGVLDIADELKAKFDKSVSDAGPNFLLHDRVYSLKKLLGENTSGEFIHKIQEKYKTTNADKPMRLLKQEVSPEKMPDYYISRTFFSQTELDEEIFRDDLTKEHVFVVKGGQKSELARASGFEMIESSKNQLDKITVRFILLEREEDFEKICTITTKPVHMIKFQNGRFFWLKSTQGVDVIQSFQKKLLMNTNEGNELENDSRDDEESEDTSSDSDDSDENENSSEENENFYGFGEIEAVNRIISLRASSAVGIAESPGMGKTYVLTSLAENIGQSEPNAVVIFIVLQELIKQTYSTNFSYHLDYIFNYATEDHTKKSILKEMWNSNLYQFYLFFDGYDEVFQEKLKLVDSILQHLLKTRNVKIIVTTRKHLKSRLEKLFNSLSFQMLPFNEFNQINFLTKYWTTKHGAEAGESLEEFARKCLKKLDTVMTDKEKIIAGIPLQCMMLAEIYSNDAIRASQQKQVSDDAVKEFSFFQMYKNLIDVKFNKISSGPVLRKKYKDAHVHLSIALLFPDWLEKFNPLLSSQDDIDKNILFSIGLLEKSPFLSTPRFVHRTFAEYILADFIIEHINKSMVCAEFLIQRILGRDGTTEEKKIGKPINLRLKHSVIAYFLNMHLQDRFPNTPAALTSLNLQSISGEDACIATVSCCCNNLEACFKLLANIISHFNIKDQEELKDKYFKHLLHLTIENTNSVSFVRGVLNLTQHEFVANIGYHVYQERYRLDSGLDIPDCTPLHVAVRKGKYNIVMFLLQVYGQGVFAIKNLLHVCVFQSIRDSESVIEERLSVIDALYQLNKDWLEEERDTRTPLLENRIHVRIAEHLVRLGVGINAYSSQCGTILHTAGNKNSYTDLVRWALRSGFVLVNHRDVDEATPLMRAIMDYGTVDDEVLQLLFEAGADFNAQDDEGFSVLFHVIECSGSLHLLQKILDFRVDPNHRDKKGGNVAHLIFGGFGYYESWTCNDLLEMLKLLKSRGFIGFNEKDYNGKTPIMLARSTKVTSDDKIFQFLHAEGVDFNAQDNHGNSVLFHAIRHTRNLDFINKILELGANLNHTNLKCQNACHWAILNYNKAGFEDEEEQEGESEEEDNSEDGEYIEEDDYKNIEEDEEQDPSLNLEIVKLLESRGFVGFNDRDCSGDTPLKLAIKQNISHDELLKFLRDRTSECSGKKRKLAETQDK